jgi:hypothetical protein
MNDLQEAQAATIEGASVSITAGALHDLLAGAIIATGKDSALPTLTGILLESSDTSSEGAGLSATATDRYRLITGATHFKGEAFRALLFNKNAEEVIRALKPIVKRGDPRAMIITVKGEEITFKLPEQTFNFRLLDGNFPPFEHLLVSEEAPSTRMAFNCSFLGDFDKVPTGESGRGKTKVPVLFNFHGNSKLVTITIHHPVITWRGGIMPMRYAD